MKKTMPGYAPGLAGAPPEAAAAPDTQSESATPPRVSSVPPPAGVSRGRPVFRSRSLSPFHARQGGKLASLVTRVDGGEFHRRFGVSSPGRRIEQLVDAPVLDAGSSPMTTPAASTSAAADTRTLHQEIQQLRRQGEIQRWLRGQLEGEGNDALRARFREESARIATLPQEDQYRATQELFARLHEQFGPVGILK